MTYVEMVNPQGAMLDEIADRRMTRDDVAMTYAFAIRQRDEVDFALVNKAIMDRWSLSALEYIKNKAWKMVEGRTA
jgi:coenzyme F420-reducing hydrogenase gamma subunit